MVGLVLGGRGKIDSIVGRGTIGVESGMQCGEESKDSSLNGTRLEGCLRSDWGYSTGSPEGKQDNS